MLAYTGVSGFTMGHATVSAISGDSDITLTHLRYSMDEVCSWFMEHACTEYIINLTKS